MLRALCASWTLCPGWQQMVGTQMSHEQALTFCKQRAQGPGALAGRGGGHQLHRDPAGPNVQGEDLSQNTTIGLRGKCKEHEGWVHRLEGCKSPGTL